MDATRSFEQERSGDNEIVDSGYDGAGVRGRDEQDEYVALPVLELDDHNIQVRALNLWVGLLEDRRFPAIEDLSPEDDEDLGPFGILLDFTRGRHIPSIAYLGARLAEQCGVDRKFVWPDLAPPWSLLRKLAEHYVPVLERRAPGDFKAEGVDRLGDTVAYSGIMLPFSSDDDEVDFVYGIINWKVLEDERQDVPDLASSDVLLLDQELQSEQGSGDEDSVLLLEQEEAVPEGGTVEEASGPTVAASEEAQEGAGVGADNGGDWEPTATATGSPDSREFHERLEARPISAPAPGFGGGMVLGDWLAEARELAALATSSEERSRKALYRAIGVAYDFSIAAAKAPEDFAELVCDAGITIQERAPMTAVAKLVFGSDYDKKRLTEFAAALSYAHRMKIERGEFGDFLARAEGGLKGIVGAEREARRGYKGPRLGPADGPRPALAKKLRKIAPMPMTGLASQGDEFTLVLAHRLPEGGVVMLGEIPRDIALLERAARKLIKQVD